MKYPSHVALLHDSEGRLHGRRSFFVIAGLVFLIGFATVLVGLLSSALSATVVAIAALVVLILFKAPLLAIIWHLMGRHLERPGHEVWSDEERQEILAYLERQARESVGRPDARARLDYLTREAWAVADRSPDEDKAQAVATALRIRAMTPAPAERSRPPER
jgi:hypothetical protein